MLHQAHTWIIRMKGLVRFYVWWPEIDKDLELCVKSGETCQVNQETPPNVPLHPWPVSHGLDCVLTMWPVNAFVSDTRNGCMFT